MKYFILALALIIGLATYTPTITHAAGCGSYGVTTASPLVRFSADSCVPDGTDYFIRITNSSTGALVDYFSVTVTGGQVSWSTTAYPQDNYTLEFIYNPGSAQILYSVDFTIGVPTPPVVTHGKTIKCFSGRYLGINTAIGCIPIETQTLLSKFFIVWTIGISGGTGLFLFGYSAYLIMIGARDPKKKLLGKDIFWSTLSGMLMLVLSIYFLNAIGIGILGLVQIGT